MTPIPKGHKWLICTCPICTEIRGFKSAKKKRPSMLKHLYEARRNGHVAIFGTVLAGLSAFWEFVLIKILWNKKIRFWGLHNIKHNPFPHPYNIPIKNGYALVLLSWAFVIWWTLVTVFLGVFYLCIGFAYAVYIGIWLTCFFGISAFYIPALVYSIFPELPASIVNKDLGKIDKRKLIKHAKYTNSALRHSQATRIGVFVGFILLTFIGWGLHLYYLGTEWFLIILPYLLVTLLSYSAITKDWELKLIDK